MASQYFPNKTSSENTKDLWVFLLSGLSTSYCTSSVYSVFIYVKGLSTLDFSEHSCAHGVVVAKDPSWRTAQQKYSLETKQNKTNNTVSLTSDTIYCLSVEKQVKYLFTVPSVPPSTTPLGLCFFTVSSCTLGVHRCVCDA